MHILIPLLLLAASGGQDTPDALLRRASGTLDHALELLRAEETDSAALQQAVQPAFDDIQAALEASPNRADAYVLLGWGAELLGWRRRAETAYRRAVELDGDLVGAHFRLGRLLAFRVVERSDLPDEALRELQAAADSQDLPNRNRFVARTLIALLQGDRAAAEAAASEGIDAIQEGPPLEVLYCLRALSRQGEGRSDDFAEALDRWPNFPLARLCRARDLFAAGDLDGADADLEAALRIDPRNAAAHSVRGRIRAAQGNTDGAMEEFGAALEIDPEFAPALVHRGNLKRESGDVAGAIADYGEVIRLRPDQPEAYAGRGDARRATGDMTGAVADYREALRLAPESWPRRAQVEEALRSLEN